jgi:hypothetical protein
MGVAISYETEILVEQQPPQGVVICDYTCLVIHIVCDYAGLVVCDYADLVIQSVIMPVL